MQHEREKKAAEEAKAELINMSNVHFHGADSDDDIARDFIEIDKQMASDKLLDKKRDKKSLKVSSKMAPLVAALNEQAANKGSHLSEQEQLLRKNKKKANQQNRKQK